MNLNLQYINSKENPLKIILETMYDNYKFPALEKLYKLVQDKHPSITNSQLKQFLSEQEAEQVLN